MQIDMNRFKKTFFEESGEHLAAMESGLLALESGAADQETIHAVFRAVHSVKGAAGAFEFQQLAGFAHVVETLLDELRSGARAATETTVALLLNAVDTLRTLLADAAAVEDAAYQPVTDTLQLAALAKALEEAAKEPEVAPEGAEEAPEHAGNEAGPVQDGESSTQSAVATRWHLRFQPGREIFRSGMDPALLLRDLERLGQLELEVVTDRIPALAEMDPGECYLEWECVLETAAKREEILDVFAFVEDEARIELTAAVAEESAPVAVVVAEAAAGVDAPPDPVAAKPQERAVAAPKEESIRVATRKVDKLIDLVGELVIAQSMASAITSQFTPADLEALRGAIGQLERFSRELQDTVLSVRMLPVGGVFGRLPRLVRDLGVSLGKQVELKLAGEETELDKSVVERLSDPLTHLVRNAVDHGIEPPEERLAAGKPERGTVEVRAYHEAGNVYVEVRDDGRGLHLDRIRRKAIAQGLLREGEDRTPEQLRQLIFQAGFSTAAVVSNVSGRGVGMDVVKRNVEAMNGSVQVVSKEGEGTTIRVKLPLTLAILDGQCLRVGGETYILPLVSIIESIRPRPEQVQAVAGQGELVLLRGEPVRLLRLHTLFQVQGETDPSRGLVVIVEHEGQRLALLVDELDAQTQVVVKSLETNFRKVEGFAGATILGNGRAALILDVAGIATLADRAG